jgi:hypothetical protein
MGWFPNSFLKPYNILTYLLTYSMVRSPSWEANWFAVSQEIRSTSRKPEVHYHTHKRPPPVSILDQPNPVHIPTSHLLEIHPNIIHPPTPRSPQWSHSLRFPHQEPIHLLSSSIRATCPAHLKPYNIDQQNSHLLNFSGASLVYILYDYSTIHGTNKRTVLPEVFPHHHPRRFYKEFIYRRGLHCRLGGTVCR